MSESKFEKWNNQPKTCNCISCICAKKEGWLAALKCMQQKDQERLKRGYSSIDSAGRLVEDIEQEIAANVENEKSS